MKKNKFNLAHLVHCGYIKEGDTLSFVSNPLKTCVVTQTPNHEFKVKVGNKEETLFNFVQTLLGQEPPDHASKWVMTVERKTLYDLWQKSLELDE
jgi:hypothetical protein